ncbi:MAG: hypothetical protein ISR90_05900 [Candidatus Marinimicrobia bacterium]|nr:hypothetical protein [Candidatus Neomarinimicrobiota bacterium]MBL7023566.1 hypothetical protein [Candidatus Neomarinimicrobiota bacterium]MBL7109853.1 hypothetical protein [Candidatus Neomarinimicrobiota bacterium]
MRNLVYILLFGFIIAGIPQKFTLNPSSGLLRNENSVEGLLSNAIVSIKHSDSAVLFATGNGLGFINKSDIAVNNLQTFISEQIPNGGCPALAVKDNIIAVSGVVDTLALGQFEPKGTGIGYSTDGGESWSYKPQPVDPKESPQYLSESWGGQEFNRLAVTTAINNISYDLAILGNYIYSASWAGGIQRFDYTNLDSEWEPIPLPMDNQTELICGYSFSEDYELNPNDPGNGGSHNHKGFSVYAIGDSVLWVGTAGGINKGFVNGDCIDWTHYSSVSSGFSGNWVIGFAHQDFGEFVRVWAITWSTGGSETNALSYTDDDGESWNIVQRIEELNLKVYGISALGDTVLASTDDGLYMSIDSEYWGKFTRPKSIDGEQILSEMTYSATTTENRIWVGTPDGLATTEDNGMTWNIYRFWETTKISNNAEDKFYAYPNPFYVNDALMVEGDGHVRFVYFLDGNYNPVIDIYDFSMELVIHLSDSHSAGNYGEGEIIWNGKNDWGDTVANGVYFCRLSLGDEIYWTKLMVVN